jgi:hypothetical protein
MGLPENNSRTRITMESDHQPGLQGTILFDDIINIITSHDHPPYPGMRSSDIHSDVIEFKGEKAPKCQQAPTLV